MATPTSILELSPAIQAAIFRGLAPEKPIPSAEFIDTVEHRDNAGLEHVFPDFESIESKWSEGDLEGALFAALTVIGKTARQNFMLAWALAESKKALSAEIVQNELRRRAGNREDAIERQKLAKVRKDRARQLWTTEYSARVDGVEKMKKKTACAKIASDILKEERERGETPTSLTGRRVKDYLDRETLDNG